MNELARALAVGHPVGQIFQADRRFGSVLMATPPPHLRSSRRR
jgi:hypothetical protein